MTSKSRRVATCTGIWICLLAITAPAQPAAACTSRDVAAPQTAHAPSAVPATAVIGTPRLE